MRMATRQRDRLALTVLSSFLVVGIASVLVDSLDSPDALAQDEASQRNFWEERKNLHVLPKDIPAAELRGLMVGAAQGLGVRCWFCHIGEEGQDLATFDFATDEKTHKAIAREMFKMVMGINQEHMPKIAELSGKEEATQVRCVTCHRGEAEPKFEARQNPKED
jgi:hypothetical protein